MKATDLWVGLGSNIDHPVLQIQQALKALAETSGMQLLRTSSLYRSAPIGGVAQDDFINAVALIETTLTAQACLTALHAIEQTQLRERAIRWGPRTLDLDILLFGDALINSETLTIPHPRMLARGFVLLPLAELAPMLVVPGQDKTVQYLAAQNTDQVSRDLCTSGCTDKKG